MKAISRIIKKLSLFFSTRNAIMKEYTRMDKIINSRMTSWITQIETLDQDKLYAIEMPEANQDQVEQVYLAIQEIRKRMLWTAPQIIIVNAKINELSPDRMKKIIDRYEQYQKESEKQ